MTDYIAGTGNVFEEEKSPLRQLKENSALSRRNRQNTSREVDRLNNYLKDQELVRTQDMGITEFMEILTAQMSNQDPMSPMEDKAFIAQMAQFSSLEQITEMTGSLAKVNSAIRVGQAYGLLGKNVTIVDAEQGLTINGKVQEVTGQEFPRVLVNGQYYSLDSIAKISNSGDETEKISQKTIEKQESSL